MSTMDDYIFGNSALHDQLCVAAEILGKLVSSAPRAVSIGQLETVTERSARELKKLCGGLSRAGLLRQEAGSDRWLLACPPSAVTLEDVFRCVIAERQGRAKPLLKPDAPQRGKSDVDLLVMQATIAVNQSVFKHLRQFSLDRLKISSVGIFPSVAPGLYHAY